MPSSKQPKWYAVAAGHQRGVFTSWDVVEPWVRGYPNARHKSFNTEAEAAQWLQQNMDATSASNPLGHPDTTQLQQQGPVVTGGVPVGIAPVAGASAEEPKVLDAKDTDGRTALHLAVMNGRKEAVDKLITARVPLLTVDSAGNTALHLACEGGNAAIVKLLIYADTAALRRLNSNGDSPIHVAAAQGQLDVFELLATQSADVPGPFGKLTLQIAADAGFPDAVKLRQWNEENINVRTGAGDTPLIVAARAGHAAICKALIKLGADVNCKNTAGQTALHAAAWRSSTRTDIATLLLDATADVHAVAVNGVTPLHCAAFRSNVGLVAQLLSVGANPAVREAGRGETALFWAVRGTRPTSAPPRVHSLESVSTSSGQADPQLDTVRLLLKHHAAVFLPPWPAASSETTFRPVPSSLCVASSPSTAHSAGAMSALQLAVDLENDAVARLLFSTVVLQNQHHLPLSELPRAIGRMFAATVDAGTQHDAPSQTNVTAAAEATTVAAAAEQYLTTQDPASVLRSFDEADQRFRAALGEGCAADGDAVTLQEARAALVAAAGAVEAVPDDATPFNEALSDGTSTDASPLATAARCADALTTLVCDAQADLVGLSEAIVTAGRSFTVQQWRDRLRSTKDRAVTAKQEQAPWCEPGGLAEATQRLCRLEAAECKLEICRREQGASSSCSRPVGNESEAALRAARDAATAAFNAAEATFRNAKAAADESAVHFPGLRRPGPNEAAVIDDVSRACRAAMAGDTATVEHIVLGNPSALNYPDMEGMTLLHHAAAGGHLRTVRMLVCEQGASITAKSLDGKTPADMSSNPDITSFFLQRLIAAAGRGPAATRRPLGAQSADGGLSENGGRLTERNARRHLQNDVESVVEQQSSLGLALDDDEGCAFLDE